MTSESSYKKRKGGDHKVCKKMKKSGFSAAASVVCALFCAIESAAGGESVSVGLAGDVVLEKCGATLAPKLFDKSWSACKVKGGWHPGKDGSYSSELCDKDGVVAAVVARHSLDGDKAKLSWTFEVRRDWESAAIAVSVDFPTSRFGGGCATLGDKAFNLPSVKGEKPWIGGAACAEARVEDGKGGWFALSSGGARWMMLQDNREWKMDVFTLRIQAGDAKLKAGERRTVELTLSADGGVGELTTGPVVISAGAGWVPLSDTTDVIPGSALDFSKLGWIDAPAGKYGRVVARDAHFEFEKKPDVAQRFYGCNLCFSANFLSESEANALCSRMARLGYNALRIHHYERDLCDRKDGTTILPEKMAELDNLLNACIENGIYLTTDLFVSRAVPWRSIGVDRDGEIPMDNYKDLVLFDEGAYSNYTAFARAFLGHVNPKTGRRWADEPALAFLALVNEGNAGNHGYAFMESQSALRAKWTEWLAKRKAESPALYADITEKFPANAWENTRQNCAFTLFLADLEIGFCDRMRKFLEDEIKTDVLISDMSSWKNPVAYQLVRTHYDYVDDHFYVDHPQFIEHAWRLPSKCANANPVRRADWGFEGVARHRLLDRPFTITEFNYSAPGQFRGVGGMMLGAQAALQEYDGIWRFAWSHSKDGVLNPEPIGYFDVARDPLQRATERAVLALYMRRDMKPLEWTFAVKVSESTVRSNLDCGPHVDVGDMRCGWFARFGTWTRDGKPSFADAVEYTKTGSMNSGDIVGLVSDHGTTIGNSQVAIDSKAGVFVVQTERTQGFFVEEGPRATKVLAANVYGAPAAIWASSLDNRPLERSRRILLTHVTDVQDEGTTYADGRRTVLLKWGRLPHLMRAGSAEITLRLEGFSSSRPKVYALRSDGSRRGEVESSVKGGALRFTADTARDPSDATFLYEIVR